MDDPIRNPDDLKEEIALPLTGALLLESDGGAETDWLLLQSDGGGETDYVELEGTP